MKKLFYDSAYIRTFEAKVLSCEKKGKRDMRWFWTRPHSIRKAADSRMIWEFLAERM